MTAAEILERATAAHIRLWAESGELKYRGPRAAVDELLPHLAEHKPALLRMVPSRVTVETRTAACDVAVPADRVIDFQDEARRRGLVVRYRLRGSKTTSTVMAPPGKTPEQLKASLTAEFGDRLTLEEPK